MGRTPKEPEEREPAVSGSAAMLRARQQPSISSTASGGGTEWARRVQALLALHPEVTMQFRKVDLAQMDEPSLRVLFGNIQSVVGIKKWKRE